MSKCIKKLIRNVSMLLAGLNSTCFCSATESTINSSHVDSSSKPYFCTSLDQQYKIPTKKEVRELFNNFIKPIRGASDKAWGSADYASTLRDTLTKKGILCTVIRKNDGSFAAVTLCLDNDSNDSVVTEVLIGHDPYEEQDDPCLLTVPYLALLNGDESELKLQLTDYWTTYLNPYIDDGPVMSIPLWIFYHLLEGHFSLNLANKVLDELRKLIDSGKMFGMPYKYYEDINGRCMLYVLELDLENALCEEESGDKARLNNFEFCSFCVPTSKLCLGFMPYLCNLNSKWEDIKKSGLFRPGKNYDTDKEVMYRLMSLYQRVVSISKDNTSDSNAAAKSLLSSLFDKLAKDGFSNPALSVEKKELKDHK